MPHIQRAWLPLVIAVGLGCSNRTSISPVQGVDPPADVGASDLDLPPDEDAPADPDVTPDVDPVPPDPFEGLYRVSGSDARGAYEGDVELRRSGPGQLQLTRVVRYPGVVVEGDRELWWVFRGTVSDAASPLSIAVTLKRLDFITQRGAMTRAAAEPPAQLSGAATPIDDDDLEVAIDGPEIALREVWRDRAPLGATPLFTASRTIVPAHAPPSDVERQANFALYADYHTLPQVAPYVERPEFQAAIHGHVIDTTDREFYRQHPDALRVVDKVIDPISLRETLNRANAFRFSLRDKAAIYDRDMEQRFIDPVTGMVPDGGYIDMGYEGLYPSGDGALWTGQYLASQFFRHRVTGEAQAVANVARTLDTLLLLYEITGDWTKFARAVRRAAPLWGPWHRAAPPYEHLDWLEGGNNDMIKGLLIGYLLGWEMFCTGAVSGYEAFCPRIRTNAKHLADDIVLGGTDTNQITHQLTNKLPTNWLAAIVVEDPLEKVRYRSTAEAAYVIGKPIILSTPVFYNQGTVDWSGTQLSFTGALMSLMMAERLDLGGDAKATQLQYVRASHENLKNQRFPTWHLLRAVHDPSEGAAYVDALRLRLQEMPAPKHQIIIDRQLTPEFCMSPYPSVPWKMDWMTYPENDRTQSLYSYPLFESGTEVMSWKIGNDYRTYYPETYESPGGDFLLLYWYGRAHGVFSAAE